MRSILAFLAALLVAGFAHAQTVHSPIPAGTLPQAIAIDPILNRIYVANDGSDDVTVIDGTDHTTSTIAVNDRPYWIAVNPETHRLYVSNFGSANLSVVDGVSGTVSTTLNVGGVGWTTINPVTDKAYVIRYGGGDEVSVIQGQTYVHTSATRSYQPTALAINPVTNVLYIVHQATGDVVAIDASVDALYPTLLCPDGAGGFKPSPGQFDPEPGPCINVPDTPVAVTVNPVTNKIYALSSVASNQISVINGVGQTNPHTFTSLTPPGVTGAARAIAVNPVTNRIYAAFDAHLVVVNGADNTMTVIAAPDGPVAIGVNAMTNKIYVPNGNGTLTVLDGATNATSTLTIPSGAKGIAVNPVNNTMYVLTASGVTRIQGAATDTVQAVPITTTITPLPGNSGSASGSITLNASSSFTPSALATIRKVYFSIDSPNGPWTPATGSGPWTATYSGLSDGSHTIYAFATNGLEAPSIMTDLQHNPIVGVVASYGFTVSSTQTPSVSLASSLNPSQTGQAVTFTASVTGSAGTPTGTVAFRDGGTPISGCSSVALASGTATCTTSALAAGTHTISAAYSGNGTYEAATSSNLSQVVQTAPAGYLNVALASNGGTASASSSYGPGSPPSAVINDERNGLNWGSGGGWEDATYNAYPDWVQVNFDGVKSIDKVVVYTLRDDFGRAGPDPTDSTTFSRYGIVDFSVQAWNGTAWVTLATITGNNLVKRTITVPDFVTDRVRVLVAGALYFKSRVVEVEAWGVPSSTALPSNVALASAGATASASSNYGGGGSSPAHVIDGNNTGGNWGSGGGWEDNTYNAYPDWVQVDFAGSKAIDRVVVYSLRNNFGGNNTTPGDSETCSLYCIADYTVQGWNGASWETLATVSGNALVKRTITFSQTTTDRIRINVTAGRYFKSRIVEVEVYGFDSSEPSLTNYALGSAGGVASASSTYGGGGSSPAHLIDGARSGSNWGSGGGWEDATHNTWPDWVQIDLSTPRTLEAVVVYTLRDGFGGNTAEPTDSETFSLYGVTDFEVQYFTGSVWQTIATVTGNNLVRRAVTFTPVTAGSIRVVVNGGEYFKSRLVEVEVWGQ